MKAKHQSISLIALVLLAGCGDSRGVETLASPDTGTVTGPSIEVVLTPLSLPAAAGNYSGPLPFHAPVMTERGGPIQVGRNATQLLVEAQWTCNSPTCHMRLELENPDDQDILSVFGDGHVRAPVPNDVLVVQGKWDVAMFADGAVAGVVGEIRTSVFYNQEIPEGYSAF